MEAVVGEVLGTRDWYGIESQRGQAGRLRFRKISAPHFPGVCKPANGRSLTTAGFYHPGCRSVRRLQQTILCVTQSIRKRMKMHIAKCVAGTCQQQTSPGGTSLPPR
jgi:hypothetical protein